MTAFDNNKAFNRFGQMAATGRNLPEPALPCMSAMGDIQPFKNSDYPFYTRPIQQDSYQMTTFANNSYGFQRDTVSCGKARLG